jgi:hypothetical protein
VIGAITAGLYGTGVPPVTNSYESIATVTVGALGTDSISFTSIPSTYKHLQVRWIARDTTSNLGYAFLRFNSDSGSNYSYHTLFGDGSSVGVDTGSSQTNAVAGLYGGTANIFAANVLDILDYADTNKYKTTRVLDGFDVNGSGGYVEFTSSGWRSTVAVNELSIRAQAGKAFNQYSHFALYGIKG